MTDATMTFDNKAAALAATLAMALGVRHNLTDADMNAGMAVALGIMLRAENGDIEAVATIQDCVARVAAVLDQVAGARAAKAGAIN